MCYTLTMDTKPPYRQIADDIREKVLAGVYHMGKLPSERALIRRYGVSRATASKSLATVESEGLIVRRHGAGAFVKPQCAPLEHAYVSTLIADMDVGEFFSAICGAIANRARAYNLNLIWGTKQEFSELSRDGSLDDYVAVADVLDALIKRWRASRTPAVVGGVPEAGALDDLRDGAMVEEADDAAVGAVAGVVAEDGQVAIGGGLEGVVERDGDEFGSAPAVDGADPGAVMSRAG